MVAVARKLFVCLIDDYKARTVVMFALAPPTEDRSAPWFTRVRACPTPHTRETREQTMKIHQSAKDGDEAFFSIILY